MLSVLEIHFAACCYMTGVIWFVQLVHYPLFLSYDAGTFSLTMKRHQTLTSFVVGPVMLLEMATGIYLLSSSSVKPSIAAMNLILLVMIWLVTALVSVPLHAALERSFDAKRAERLVKTNWWRTALWSARCFLLLVGGGLL